MKKILTVKKLVTLLCILSIFLHLCACGNKLEKQAEEVAQKLDGVWAATWNAPVGELGVIFVFEYSAGDAGSVECYHVIDGEVMRHYTGTYGVSIQTEGIIELGYLGEIDSAGNINKLEKVMESTLNYTYNNGNLELIDGEKILIKVE